MSSSCAAWSAPGSSTSCLSAAPSRAKNFGAVRLGHVDVALAEQDERRHVTSRGIEHVELAVVLEIHGDRIALQRLRHERLDDRACGVTVGETKSLAARRRGVLRSRSGLPRCAGVGRNTASRDRRRIRTGRAPTARRGALCAASIDDRRRRATSRRAPAAAALGCCAATHASDVDDVGRRPPRREPAGAIARRLTVAAQIDGVGRDAAVATSDGMHGPLKPGHLQIEVRTTAPRAPVHEQDRALGLPPGAAPTPPSDDRRTITVNRSGRRCLGRRRPAGRATAATAPTRDNTDARRTIRGQRIESTDSDLVERPNDCGRRPRPAAAGCRAGR